MREAIPFAFFLFSAFPSFSVLISLSDCGKEQAGRELRCKLSPCGAVSPPDGDF